MAYSMLTPILGAQLFAETSTVPRHKVGEIVVANDPVYGAGEFIYLGGAASVGIGSWCVYNGDNYLVNLLGPNNIGPVCISMADNVAGTYGWFQINGKAVGKALAGFVDNANVYATATAGSVDDAVVAGDRVKGAVGASAVGTPSAGLAEFEIARPFMDDGLAA